MALACEAKTDDLPGQYYTVGWAARPRDRDVRHERTEQRKQLKGGSSTMLLTDEVWSPPPGTPTVFREPPHVSAAEFAVLCDRRGRCVCTADKRACHDAARTGPARPIQGPTRPTRSFSGQPLSISSHPLPPPRVIDGWDAKARAQARVMCGTHQETAALAAGGDERASSRR